MNIATSRRYDLGRFTVQERPRPDSPAWPVYIVSLQGREIGRSFSKPNEDCCEWLLRHPEGIYAPPSITPPWNYTDIQVTYHKKRGRPSKAEAAAKAARELEEEVS